MSDLLSIGRSGVLAYRNALTTVGENVANAQTEGYSRRTVTLNEVSATGSQPLYRASTSFGGVNTVSVGRAWDAFRAAEARTSAADDGRADARMRWLSTIEGALNDGAAGVGKQLTAVFTAADALASDPDGQAARTTFLQSIDGAAGAMRTTAAALTRASDGIAGEASASVDALNADLASLARINQQIARAAEGSTACAQLSDERDKLIAGVSARVGVDASYDTAGRVKLTLGGTSGAVLVDRSEAAVVKVARAADGSLALSSATTAGSTPIHPQSGALAGLVDVSSTLGDRRRALDAVATQFATTINDWQGAGLTDAAVPGADLIALGSDGAATIALAAGVTTADLAVADAGAKNGNALALGSARGAGGVEARWSSLVTQSAQQVSAAKAEASAATARNDSALAALDDVSGVDLDREAAEMLRFQQAYGASAKVIQVARETLQSILSLF